MAQTLGAEINSIYLFLLGLTLGSRFSAGTKWDALYSADNFGPNKYFVKEYRIIHFFTWDDSFIWNVIISYFICTGHEDNQANKHIFNILSNKKKQLDISI